MSYFDDLPHIAARRQQRLAEYLANGLWTNETLSSVIHDAVRRQPQQTWVFAGEDEVIVTLAELVAEAEATAEILRSDDSAQRVFALMAPNTFETAAAFLAIQLAGGICMPVAKRTTLPTLRQLAVRTGVTDLLVADSESSRMHAAHLVADGSLARAWTLAASQPIRLLSEGTPHSAEPVPPSVHPAHRVSLLGYTSGSTAEPKIVCHTDAQLLSELRGTRDALGEYTGALSPSPYGHITGVLTGILRPLLSPETVVVLDGWDPGRAVELSHRFGCSELRGTPVYFEEMMRCDPAVGGLRTGQVGGSPVSPALVQALDDRGLKVLRAYGSSEHPTIASSSPNDDIQARGSTDGRAIRGNEIWVLDSSLRPVPTGSIGEVYSRGPDAMAGYLDESLHLSTVLDDGRIASGDLGFLDDAGRLTITGRLKDVIIRGGENISATEVESYFDDWDLASEVSLVGVPDQRLGERACLFIRSAGADPITLDEVRLHLMGKGVDKLKWPEYVVVVADFPRSASGKVHKPSLKQIWLSEHGLKSIR